MPYILPLRNVVGCMLHRSLLRFWRTVSIITVLHAAGLRRDQGPPNGGVSNEGVSRSGPVCPFLSFLELSRFFWDFPDLLGDCPGIFPICPFPLSRPIKSTYEEQS